MKPYHHRATVASVEIPRIGRVWRDTAVLTRVAAYGQPMGEVRLITTAQAARVLGIHRSTLVRWAQQGTVRPEYTTPGGQFRWNLDDLRRQLRELRQRDE